MVGYCLPVELRSGHRAASASRLLRDSRAEAGEAGLNQGSGARERGVAGGAGGRKRYKGGGFVQRSDLSGERVCGWN